MRHISKLIIISAISLKILGASTSAQAQSTIKAWPETFFQTTSRSAEELKVRFTNALFDRSAQTDLFRDDFSKNFSAGVKVQRDVYNNYDLLNTWTVIDRLRININTQILGIGNASTHYLPPEDASFFPFAGISFGGNGTFEWRNMKQLAPSEVALLESIEKRKKETEAALKDKKEVPAQVTDAHAGSEDDIQDLNPYLGAIDIDSSFVVKLHNILNPLTLPFRMPLSRRDLRKMTKGEVMSYNISGQVGFGGSLGWQVLPTPDIHAGVNLGLETHLNGEFEVSVLKEDERYAKVRISRVKGHGSSATLSAGAEWKNFYQGFFLFKGKPYEIHAGAMSTRIVPFSFQTSTQLNHEIDVGYRYDLESEEGKDAFHKAVLGSLVKSEEIAQDELEHPNPSVSKLYNRSTVQSTKFKRKGMDLSLIFRWKRTLTRDDVETEVILPDQTRHLFRSYSENKVENDNLIANNEKVSRRISVIMDQEGFRNQKPGSLLVIGENVLDDSWTRPKEINHHTHDIEVLFNDPNLFPEFPTFSPPSSNRKAKEIHYGRSSFYYGYTLTEEMIKEFLHSDLNTLFALAKKYRVKIKRETLELARTAFDSRNSELTYLYLKEMFSDRKRTRELMQITVELLHQHSFEKFLVAQNPAFGNIQNRGHRITAIEKVFRDTEKEMGLSSDTNRSVADPDAVINNLFITERPDKKIEVHFILANDPNFLYFRVNPIARRNKNAVELILFNRDQRFKQGENIIVLDPNDPDPLVHRLTSKLGPNELVTFTVGYSQKDSNWGYGASMQFRTTSIYKPLAPTGITEHEL